MTVLHNIEPVDIWRNFEKVNAIPRASKKEEKIINFIKNFGESLGLETKVDATGNVVIVKSATPGFENRQTVILQSHLDMVHQKNNDVTFNFDEEGIRMIINGDWIKAEGTTLGADNGIGVAAMLAILESTNISHPKIEALFTIDEETGMTGAKNLQPGFVTGSILLNLDTEEDDEIDIGCAGGIDVTATRTYGEVVIPQHYKGYKISLTGLSGGHSGMDIHKGLGNANKLMNRILFQLSIETGIMIHSIEGGSLRNAIPRESVVTFAIHPDGSDQLNHHFQEIKKAILEEYKTLEPKLTLVIDEVPHPIKAMDPVDEIRILKAIYAAHNGVFRMSPEIENLVEASNNIAKVDIKNGQASIMCLTRSSVESSKKDVVQALTSSFELAGFQVETSGDYPGWAPNPNSKILKVASELYRQLNGTTANIVACHAGLECGIISGHYPGLDMISFGPTIRGAHSPDEKVNISSVQKFWIFLQELLKKIPE